MTQSQETLPEVLKKVSLQLINAADELNRLNRLQYLLKGALDILQDNTDQAEFMLELYEDHMHDYLEELSKSVHQARILLGHPVSEYEFVICGSDSSVSDNENSNHSNGCS